MTTDARFSGQSAAEEKANVLTHGIGAVFALVGIIAMQVFATPGTTLQRATLLVFGVTLLLTYTASTGFHLAAQSTSRGKWRLLDHVSIYTLIAGTYTPLMLVGLGGFWGKLVFFVVWSLALIGIVAKTLLVGRFDAFDKVDTLLYAVMGWLIVIAIVPTFQALSATGLWLLLAGGISYTGGTYFFLNNQIRYSHAIWHGFVLGGSALHFAAVWIEVVRR